MLPGLTSVGAGGRGWVWAQRPVEASRKKRRRRQARQWYMVFRGAGAEVGDWRIDFSLSKFVTKIGFVWKTSLFCGGREPRHTLTWTGRLPIGHRLPTAPRPVLQYCVY